MCSNEIILLSLLNTALWGKDPEGSVLTIGEACWKDIYKLSSRQMVHGLIFDVVRDLPRGSGPSSSVWSRWTSDVTLIAKKYEKNKALVGHLTEVWKSLGLEAVHQKGAAVADMYPIPQRRVCGNVDWYFSQCSQMEDAYQWADREGFEPRHYSKSMVHFLYSDMYIRLFSIPYNPADVMVTLGILNSRILKNAMNSVVKLSQLCDLAVAYRNLAGKYDVNALERTLDSKGLLAWTGLLHCVLTEFIGLPEKYLPWPCDTAKMKSDAETFIELIFEEENPDQYRQIGLFRKDRREKLLSKYLAKNSFDKIFGHHKGHLFFRKKRRSTYYNF